MASTAAKTTRSQPARQSRTAPPRKAAQLTNSRIAASVGRNPIPTGSAGSQQRYPAIYAFTDALEALPLETVRNFTLLREVDAKACLQEENVRRYIQDAQRLPPAQPGEPDPAWDYLQRQELLRISRDEAAKRGEPFPPEMDNLIAENPVEAADLHFPPTRRSRMYQVRIIINDLLPTLDEKIHVITTTNDTLTKHLTRLEDAFKNVETEIPELHRRGNLQHWAYKPLPARGTVAARAAERAERQAQAERDHSELPHRSESRREGGSRRGAQTVHDDDDVPLAKRAHGNNRAKAKEAEGSTAAHKGADKDGAAPAPKKRRAVGADKTTAAGKVAPSPRSGTPAAPAAKKTKTTNATGAAAHRKRAANSSLNSPVVASPELTGFSDIPKTADTKSGDHGTATKATTDHARPSPPTTKLETTTKDMPTRELEPPHKEPLPPIPIPLPTSKTTNRRTSVQTDDPKPKATTKPIIPPSPKPKKSAPTPINTTLPSSHRPPSSASKRKRPSPDPPTNSRKKSHTPTQPQSSSTAQMAPILPPPPPPPPPQPVQQEDSGSEETDPDPDEPRYCICNGVSYGQMVACDSETCEKEWFHLECVGLAQAPKGKAKWYCQDCITQMNSGAHTSNGRRRR